MNTTRRGASVVVYILLPLRVEFLLIFSGARLNIFLVVLRKILRMVYIDSVLRMNKFFVYSTVK